MILTALTNKPVRLARRCPNRSCRGVVRTVIVNSGLIETHCPRCAENVVFDIDHALWVEKAAIRCACCPGREFFIRKDFPQKTGLALVIVFGIVASIFFYYRNIVAAYTTLAALVLIDAALFVFVGRVTVCYRCRAEYRGLHYNPRHAAFDLAASEKYQ